MRDSDLWFQLSTYREAHIHRETERERESNQQNLQSFSQICNRGGTTGLAPRADKTRGLYVLAFNFL